MLGFYRHSGRRFLFIPCSMDHLNTLQIEFINSHHRHLLEGGPTHETA